MAKFKIATTLNSSQDGGNLTTILPEFGTHLPSKYPWWHITMASIVVTCIIVIIVLGNALVIVAIAKDKNLKQLQNWFIASLAVSDLLLGLLIMPLSLANELMGYWYFGNFLCEMWLSIDVLLCTASILNLCLISLDRYWSITRAVSYVKHRTKKKATIMITIVWILSGIICFPPLVGWKRPQPTNSGYQQCLLSQETGYVVYSTLGSFFIPLLVMVVVYFKIYLAARARARRHLKKHPSSNGQNQSRSTTCTTIPNSMAFRNSIEKLKSPAASNDDRGKCSDLDSLSPGFDVCQEVVTNEANCSADGTAIPLSDVNPTKHNNNKTSRCVNSSTLDERRTLLCDETDVNETGDDVAKRRECDDVYVKSDSDDVIANTSVIRNGTNPRGEIDPPVCRGDCVKSNAINYAPPLTNINQSNALTNESLNTSRNCVNNYSRTEMNNSAGQTNDNVIVRSTPSLKVIKTCSIDTCNAMKQAELSSASRTLKKDLLSPSRPAYINNKMSKPKKQRNKELRKTANEPERLKRKIARARERRATLVLGIIMATFILCWLPFFGTYLISTLAKFMVPEFVFAIMFWAGYCNSALNPIIYTIFNQDFRKAFQRILCKRRLR